MDNEWRIIIVALSREQALNAQLTKLSAALQNYLDAIFQTTQRSEDVRRKNFVSAKASHAEERRRLEADLSAANQSKRSHIVQTNRVKNKVTILEKCYAEGLKIIET